VTQNSLAEALAAADAKLRAGAAAQARADCKRLLAKSPSLAPAQYLLAASEIQLGNLDAATKASRRAVQLEPGNARFHFQYAQIARSQGNLGEAVRVLTEAIAIIPGDWPLYHLLGMILFEKRKYEDAETIYRRALEQWPANAAMLAQMSWVEAERGAWNDALTFATRAVAANPQLPSAHHALGDAVVMFGRYDEAVRAYETCLSLKTASPAVAKNVVEMRDDAVLLSELVPQVRNAKPDLDADSEAATATAVAAIHRQLPEPVSAPFTAVFFHVDVGTKHPFRAGEAIDYANLLRLACEAVTRAIPGAAIILITDERSDMSAVADLGRVVRLKFDPDHLMYARLRANCALVASRRLAGPVAFLDTDVFVNRNFVDVFDGGFDVGLTYRHGAGFPHMPVNEGVILGTSGDSPALAAYFRKCLAYYDFMTPLACVKKRYPFDLRRWRGGQLSVGAFVDWKTPPFAAVDLVRHGVRVRFLPGDLYNYAVGAHDDVSTLAGKWAVHFKGANAKKLMAEFAARDR